MSFSKYISKFLTRSLLVSVGISFFGCSTSYMMEQYETKKIDKKLIDDLTKAFKRVDKKKSLAHEILSGSSSDEDINEEQQIINKNLLNRKHYKSRSNKSKSLFNDEITSEIRHVFTVKADNRYLLGLTKTTDKKLYADYARNLSMLRIARLIYKLENLRDLGKLLNYQEVCDFLYEIKLIKDEVLANNKITVEQSLNFINTFSKILNKINFNNSKKCQLTLNSIKTSLRMCENKENSYKDGYVQAGLFSMFKTLEYCEKKRNHCPDQLYTDFVMNQSSCPKKDF